MTAAPDDRPEPRDRTDTTDADLEREMLDAIRAEQHEYEQVESDA